MKYRTGLIKMMFMRQSIVVILLFMLLVSTGELFAQAEQTPEKLLDEVQTQSDEESVEADAKDVEPPASNEVDVNEGYFRRSMELRDRSLQRSPDLTTGSYSRSTGLQALNALPEASQKHLREDHRQTGCSFRYCRMVFQHPQVSTGPS